MPRRATASELLHEPARPRRSAAGAGGLVTHAGGTGRKRRAAASHSLRNWSGPAGGSSRAAHDQVISAPGTLPRSPPDRERDVDGGNRRRVRPDRDGARGGSGAFRLPLRPEQGSARAAALLAAGVERPSFDFVSRPGASRPRCSVGAEPGAAEPRLCHRSRHALRADRSRDIFRRRSGRTLRGKISLHVPRRRV